MILGPEIVRLTACPKNLPPDEFRDSLCHPAGACLPEPDDLCQNRRLSGPIDWLIGSDYLVVTLIESVAYNQIGTHHIFLGHPTAVHQ